MTERKSLLEDLEPARKPIDAAWSPRKKRLVGGVCAGASVAAVAAGVWAAAALRGPGLPDTAGEALAVMSSGRFESLPEERQRQYAAEAARLLRDLSPDERRALRDEADPEALRRLGQERFDEIARRIARGEDLPPRPRRGERPPRPPREFDREAMRERIDEQVSENLESGNAQDSGLRGEMFKRFRQGGGGRGGGGGRRGGG